MKQNDIIAGVLAAGVFGGLAYWRSRTLSALQASPPTPPPGVIIPPGTPGSDVQLSNAQQAVNAALAALAAQGGGTQAQKDATATALETQAAQIDELGGSPAASAYLRQAAAALRSGQSPLPTPITPTPTPTPVPVTPATPSSDPALASAQTLIAQTVAALQSQGANVSQAQLSAAAMTLQTQAALLAATNQSPAAVALLQNAATQLQNGQIPTVPTTATNPNPPPSPVIRATTAAPATGAMRNLHARYQELREHLMAHLQGARSIDHATLGAADRTTRDLQKAGDAQRAADLGALSNASYRRAGITRPVAVPV